MVTETSVGIDYHERGVQVCVMSRDGRAEFNRKVRNDIDAVVEAIGRGRTEVTVVAEAWPLFHTRFRKLFIAG
jgi:hypothetical protein